MQNNIIIFFFIILNLTILNAQSNDQINFDVSELEILDGGNKIIGKNRGNISTADGINIEADKFEFDKTQNILKAQGNIIIKDQPNNYNFSAKEILYSKNDERIEIKGKSEVIFNENYKFEIENATILRNEMIISSDVGGVILNSSNQTRYEIGKFNYSLKNKILKGEKIFVNTKYNQPFSDKFFFKSAIFDLKNQNYVAQNIDIEFKKDIFGNENNDPRFKGISSSRKNGITTIKKGVFTSCKKNDNCPPWSIKADKITHDKVNKNIHYNNDVNIFIGKGFK